MDTDGCSDAPCSLRRKCSDLTPTEENALGRAYNCSECPSGYTNNETECMGKSLCYQHV